MKKQTFIVFLKNTENQVETFERFSCKSVITVKKNMETLFHNPMYAAITKEVVAYEIYATPNKSDEYIYIETINR